MTPTWLNFNNHIIYSNRHSGIYQMLLLITLTDEMRFYVAQLNHGNSCIHFSKNSSQPDRQWDIDMYNVHVIVWNVCKPQRTEKQWIKNWKQKCMQLILWLWALAFVSCFQCDFCISIACASEWRTVVRPNGVSKQYMYVFFIRPHEMIVEKKRKNGINGI